MEEKSIRFSVKLEMQDYQKFISLSNAKWNYGFLGFFFASMLGNIILLDNVSGIIYLLIIYAISVIFVRLSYKKQFESNKLAQKDVVYNITVNGIEIRNVDGSGNSNIQWDELYGVKQNKDIIFLMTGNLSGEVIPKRQLNTTQIADLEALIKNKLDAKAFKKLNCLKYVCIGALVYIMTFILTGTISLIDQRLSEGYSVMYLIIRSIVTILFFLQFGLGIVFIVQFFRWVYGLFVSKLRISFIKVIIPFLAAIFTTFLFYIVWKFSKTTYGL